MSVPFAAGWEMPGCFRSLSMRVILTPVSQALNLPRRLVDERRHLMDGFALDALALEPVQKHQSEVLQGAADRTTVGALARIGQLGQSGEQRVDLVLSAGEVLGPCRRDRERLARTVGLGLV